MKSPWIERRSRDRLLRIRDMAAQGASKYDATLDLQISSTKLNSLLNRWIGSCAWPPSIPDSLFSLPIRDTSKKFPEILDDLNEVAASRIFAGEDRTWEKYRKEPRDPCVGCGVRFDFHKEMGCKQWMGA